MLGFGDPVADAIGLLRPRTVIEPSLSASNTWAVGFDAIPHVKIGGLVRGEAWLALERQDPVLLEEGDTFLMSNPPAHVLGSALNATPQPAESLRENGGVITLGGVAESGTGDTYVCSGCIELDTRNVTLLTDLLPPLVVVRAADPRGLVLGQLIELLAAEVDSSAPGAPLVQNHLAQLILVHMLRAHAADVARPSGWLGALGDDAIGGALRAMHEDVSRSWTLVELAEISHMSRAAFAQAFKNRVGVPPVEYLIQWRMSLARDALAHDTMSISELSRATGYLSESAFSTAFRRVVGQSPARFRSTARQPTPPVPA